MRGVAARGNRRRQRRSRCGRRGYYGRRGLAGRHMQAPRAQPRIEFVGRHGAAVLAHVEALTGRARVDRRDHGGCRRRGLRCGLWWTLAGVGAGDRQAGQQAIDRGGRWSRDRADGGWSTRRHVHPRWQRVRCRRRIRRDIGIRRDLPGIQALDLDARGAGAIDAQLHRGGVAQVDDAAVVERARDR